jgi:hypothetical protein
MKHITSKTYSVDVYLSGRYEKIKDVLSLYTLKGLCISIEKVDYIYTHGIESGAKVQLINYPRFPTSEDDLLQEAIDMGKEVLSQTGQGSFTVVSPDTTHFFSVREKDKDGELL